jgi:hypothetical protein
MLKPNAQHSVADAQLSFVKNRNPNQRDDFSVLFSVICFFMCNVIAKDKGARMRLMKKGDWTVIF